MKGYDGVVTLGIHSLKDTERIRLDLSKAGKEICERLFGEVPQHGQWYENECGELCLKPVNLNLLRQEKIQQLLHS